MDRDLNAARNLALLVDANANGVAGSGPETENRPWMGRDLASAGSSSTKREAGTGRWAR
jgi:transposase